ncbi:MAG TPA: hypothetical protein PLZ43_13700 [bacterium]|nr:hypothetical protein [bacterium]
MKVARWVGTPVIIGLLWVLCAVFAGNYFAENLPFESVDVEDYVFILRVDFAVSAVTALLFAYAWYLYGGSKSVSMNLKGAVVTWWLFFLFCVIAAVCSTAYYVFKFESEKLGMNHHIVIFCLFSAITYIPFYFLTLLMSPLNVKYTVPGRKLIG